MNALRCKYPTVPYKHQLDCLQRFGEREAFALCADPGTGKSFIIIMNICELWAQDKLEAVLILAPNGVHENWTRLELKKHMPLFKPNVCVTHTWKSGGGKKVAREFDRFLLGYYDTTLKILTMNWEALASMKGREAAERYLKMHPKSMIICDESDAMKNPAALRTKAILKLVNHSRYRRIVTGTPVNNAPFDLFTQYNFLDERILKTGSYYAFKSEYAEMLPAGHPIAMAAMRKSGGRFAPQIVAKSSDGTPRYRNLEKLRGLIEPHTFRVTKDECLDLPEKLYTNVFFDMTDEQKAVYLKVENECRLMFDGEETAINKIVAIGKLSQITSGYYLHPDAEEPVRIEGGTPKLDLLVERLERLVERGEKAIVWARYRVEIADIVERLRQAEISFVEYHGGTARDDRTEAIDAFERGDARVFVGNQQAAGVGITLVAASNVMYFSNSFSLRDRLQSEDRAHRIGQTKKVTYVNLIAKDTIDERIAMVLGQKKDVAAAIVGGRFW